MIDEECRREEQLSNGAKPESVRHSPPEMWSRASHELFCVEMMDRRNLKVFASFESNTSPSPRPPPCDACATRLQCSLMMQHNGGAWQLWRR
ncbi:unnamed protein product [Boreogadus saida]